MYLRGRFQIRSMPHPESIMHSNTPAVSTTHQPLPWLWLCIALGLIAVELLTISLTHKDATFIFSCKDAAPRAFCQFAGRIVPRSLAVLAGLVIFAAARPQSLHTLLRGHSISGPWAVALNLTGFTTLMAPRFFIGDDSSPQIVSLAIALWVGGGALATSGLLLLAAPLRAWASFWRRAWKTLGALVVFALALPELTDMLQPLWKIDYVADMTFRAVVWILESAGYDLYANATEKVIGANGFLVLVGPKCSGVEGFALISAFVTVYLWLFRADLRFPHALLLFPIGIAISGFFNIARIALLLAIGFEISPDLAVGAFHSYAGWLSFTLLSLGLILLSRALPFFTDRTALSTLPPATLPPFFHDRTVAELLPFAIFMLSALLVSTFSQTPGLIYPARAGLMLVAMALFWPVYASLEWRLDPLAIGSGATIALMWIMTAPAAGDSIPAFANLTGMAFAGWVTARVLGTALLVPVIEEMMFRSYLLTRLAPKGTGAPMLIGVLITSALFAALHDRWIEAAIAGVVFGLLVWRSRNVTDAIVSHAVANGAIAAFALATGAWHII